MKSRVRHLIAPLAILAMLAFVAPAGASPGAVVRDCAQDGTLDGEYSDADKRAALGQLPADLDEYSECRALIGGSIGGPKAGASSSGPGLSGAEAKTPRARRAAERKARKVREERLRKRAREVRERKLGARAVDPRDDGVFKAANTANGLPMPVALAVAALALLALTGGARALGGNPKFAGALRRVTPSRFRRG